MTDFQECGRLLEFLLSPDQAGQRLDQALAMLLPDRSRAFVKKILDRGGVAVDGKPGKGSLKVRGGEKVAVFVPDPQPLEAAAEDLPLDVLYEDEALVVVNKRPGMVAHPSPGHRDGTLVNALLHHCGDSLSGVGGMLRPGIVHRLDKDTSGCLVTAKTDAAHRALVQQFMEREVEKIYLAITDGVPRPVSGVVEVNLGRSRNNRKVHAVLPSGGRHSLTRYRTLENYGAVALVECRLMTGRTHQARVHLAHVGAPVLCDRDYGRQEFFTSGDAKRGVAVYRGGRAGAGFDGPERTLLERQALHAWKLAFRHPVDGRVLSFEAPPPEDMLAVLEPFRQARREMEAREGAGVPGK